MPRTGAAPLLVAQVLLVLLGPAWAGVLLHRIGTCVDCGPTPNFCVAAVRDDVLTAASNTRGTVVKTWGCSNVNAQSRIVKNAANEIFVVEFFTTTETSTTTTTSLSTTESVVIAAAQALEVITITTTQAAGPITPQGSMPGRIADANAQGLASLKDLMMKAGATGEAPAPPSVRRSLMPRTLTQCATLAVFGMAGLAAVWAVARRAGVGLVHTSVPSGDTDGDAAIE